MSESIHSRVYTVSYRNKDGSMGYIHNIVEYSPEAAIREAKSSLVHCPGTHTHFKAEQI